MSAAVLIKFLTRKNLLDWQGLVLAAPRAPAQKRSKARCALTPRPVGRKNFDKTFFKSF